MKISVWINASDLVSIKKTLLERFIGTIMRDEKRHIYKTQTIASILKSLRASGVDGLELLIPLLTSDQNIKEIKSISKKYNMPVLSVHHSSDSFYNISLKEIVRLCAIANDLCARVVVLHINVLGNRLFDNNFIKELKELQKKYKITFGIENMPKTPFSFYKTYFSKGDDFSSVIKKADINITFDTTHLAQVGEDICKFYIKNKEGIVNIHLSNYRKHWLNTHLLLHHHTHLSLKEGELPILKFLKILKKENYQGLITMEINSDIEGLCESAKMIKKTLRS